MSSQNEETPPPPPLSEAPPSYFSRDSLVDLPPADSTITQLHCYNPRFEQDNVSPLTIPFDNNSNDETHRVARGDLPPPYSPGLAALFSTRLPEHNVNDAPPSYYSLFGQIREAREQSGNNITFLRRVGQIILNTVGCTILLLVFMSVPIAILVLGSLFVHNCPLEPLIPVYLIIGGISGILKNVLLIFENIIKRYSEQLSSRVDHSKCVVYVWRMFNLVFNLFMLAWTIAGGYWVYHIYTEVTNSEYSQCTELLYKFGFGIVTSSYILLLLTCACVCCCAGICLKANSRRRRASSSLSGSEPRSSAGNSEHDNQSNEDNEDQRNDYSDDERSAASPIEDYRTETLMSTLSHTHEGNDEDYLRRFRYLDSTTPLSTAGLERSILHYESSPYPTRHREVRTVHHSSLENTVHSNSHTPTSHSNSSHGEYPVPSQPVSGSNYPIPTPTRAERPCQLPHDRRGDSLYITLSSDGFSVTEV